MQTAHATILAIISGPILALLAARLLESWAQKKNLRLEVLRTLMRTRSSRLSPDHVAALNSIEIEFYGKKKIINKYSEYVKHLSSPMPAPNEQDRYTEQRNELFVELIQLIGKQLRYNLDKGDLSRLAYAPIAWEDQEKVNRENNQLLRELLQGKRSIAVATAAPTQFGSFPPPPE